MEFRLLGPFEVVDGERRLDLGPRKQRAVLAVLAITPNNAVSIDRLIDDLWGEQPPPQAVGTMQAYVSNLRRILEPGRTPREPARVLMTQRPGYVLAVPPASVDVCRFEAAVAEGSRLLGQGQYGPAKRCLAEGLGLWRGDFLADFASEPFARAEASRLQDRRLGATEDLLRAELELGDYRQVITEADALVGAHPLREQVWGLLMIALYRSGRRPDALRTYERARQTLADEFGIDPGPELRRLGADILAQASALEWRASAPPADTVDAGRVQLPSTGSTREWAFVGRRAELAHMQARVRAAVHGRGGVLLIGGEPGIGKTRLVEELLRLSEGEGLATAWGGAVEGGASPAYWPFVRIVRTLLHEADPQVVADAFGPGAAELALVVPDVKEVIGPVDPAPMVDPETARVRLFEAVLGLLACVARQRPLVVVLDDLQWADVASLQLLSFLGPWLRDLPVLVVATYRPSEIDAADHVSGALVTLGRHGVLERSDLRGLDRDEVGGLVLAVTGEALTPDMVATVEARTGGNPFFVAELARLLRSPGNVDAVGEARTVPAGVRDVVRRQLARLPDDTSSLLALAAVAGSDFDLPVLEAAARVEPDLALDMVESALLTGVVLEHPEVIGRFRFSHDLVRETILDGLTGVRRARLHARLAEALEALHGHDDGMAVELAYHSFHAAPVAGAERGIGPALRAAAVATARLAHEQAEDQLRRAYQLSVALPSGEEHDRRQLDILLRLGSTLTITKGYAEPEIGEVLEQARLLCSKGDDEQVLRALFGLMMFHLVAGRHQSARQLAAQLLALATHSGRAAERVVAHLSVGTAAVHLGELDVARHHLEQALGLQEAVPAVRVQWLPMHPRVFASTFLAWTLWEVGERGAAFRLVEEGLDFATELGHDLTTAHALDCAARIAVLDRDAAHALEQSERALAVRGRQGSPLYAAIHAVHHGWATAHLGAPESGIAEIEAGLAAMEATGAWMIHTLFLALLAEAQRQAGRIQDALASVERGLRFVQRTGERFWEPELYRLKGELLLQLSPDHRREGLDQLRRAVTIAGDLGATSLERRAAEALRAATTA